MLCLTFLCKSISTLSRRKCTTAAPQFTNCGSFYCNSFKEVSVEEVKIYIKAAPSKQCALDPGPTWLIKKCSDLLSPFITNIINASISMGHFATTWKLPLSNHLVKKLEWIQVHLQTTVQFQTYHFFQKVLECVIHKQVTFYLSTSNLFPPFQSAYRFQHSSETALVKVFSDIVDALIDGNIAILALLHLTTSFDTVDQQILQRLQRLLGIVETALCWFKSFVISRTQAVHLSNNTTPSCPLVCGVPQGYLLGPLLFILNTVDIGSMIAAHGLLHVCYADDM